MTRNLSVIIVTFNSSEYIVECLSSIKQSSSDVVREVIVVDNASSDGTVRVIEEKFPSVTIVRNSINRGFATAINQGAAKADGGYLFILNPDAILTDDGLEDAVKFMDEHRRVGAVGVKIVNPGGTIQLSSRSFPSYRTIFFSRYSLMSRFVPNNRFSRKFLMSDWDHATEKKVDWVSGAAMLLRKSALEEVGGFDEDYFLFIEDIDLCWRLREKGWEVYYLPSPIVRHHIGKSSEKTRLRSIYHHHRGISLFYRKHYKKQALNALLGIGLFLRALFLMVARSLSGKRIDNER